MITIHITWLTALIMYMLLMISRLILIRELMRYFEFSVIH